MSLPPISEAHTVQFPMVQHAADIGWIKIPPDKAKTKRGGDAGGFFRDVLQQQLAAFNPWLATDAIGSIMETLDALPATIEGNRQMLAWLRGERQWFDEAENRHRPVVLIDFKEPSNNQLHVTWEWRSKSSTSACMRRASRRIRPW